MSEYIDLSRYRTFWQAERYGDTMSQIQHIKSQNKCRTILAIPTALALAGKMNTNHIGPSTCKLTLPFGFIGRLYGLVS